MAGNTNPQTLLGGYINRKGGDRVTGEPAFVLRMEPWSETSLLVDFYTRHHGRILARRRGADPPPGPGGETSDKPHAGNPLGIFPAPHQLERERRDKDSHEGGMDGRLCPGRGGLTSLRFLPE